MARALSGWIVGGAALLVAAPAFAQEQVAPNQGMFARDRNVSVTQRPQPGYEPVPVRLGAFTALPKLDAGVEYNDNIYAVNSGQKSDTIFTLNPELDVQSNWARNALQAYIRSATRGYAKYSSETTTDYQLGGSGRLDAGNGQFSGGGDTGLLTEPRTSPSTTSGTTHPVRYQQSDGFFSGVEELNRIRLTGRFDLVNLDYHNGVDPLQRTVIEDDRDHTNYTYSGKVEYAVSPDTSVYVVGSYNDHQYRLQPPTVSLDRNSHGGTVTAGSSFDLTNLVRGDVQIGYLTQDFDAKTLTSVSGFTALASLEWFPTQLTTVTLTGSRQIQDSAALNSAVFIAGVASLQVDHELLRNLILTGRFNYEDDSYFGVSRDDHSTGGYVGARYMLNRLVGVSAGYTYANLHSTGAQRGPLYTVNRFMISTNLRF